MGATYSEVLQGDSQPERHPFQLYVDIDEVQEARPYPEDGECYGDGEELIVENVHCFPESLFSASWEVLPGLVELRVREGGREGGKQVRKEEGSCLLF